MKFLVVDDEKDVKALFELKLRKELKQGDLEIEFALSGEEALEILKSKDPPDVVYIFSDINMPGMTGLELMQAVKQKFPYIHVSMISAYGDTESQNNAIKAGAKMFFTKPIDFELLRSEIHQVMVASN